MNNQVNNCIIKKSGHCTPSTRTLSLVYIHTPTKNYLNALRGSSMGKMDLSFLALLTSLGQVLSYSE